VRAFTWGATQAVLWANAETIAAGLRVPAAIGDYLILEAIRESGGTAITVTDDQMLKGMALAAEQEGLFVSPESGAAVIATRTLRESGFLGADDLTVIFATGSGLMHVDLVDRSVATIDPNAPDLLAEIASRLPLSELSDPVRN
jgi:threonine synthase